MTSNHPGAAAQCTVQQLLQHVGTKTWDPCPGYLDAVRRALAEAMAQHANLGRQASDMACQIEARYMFTGNEAGKQRVLYRIGSYSI